MLDIINIRTFGLATIGGPPGHYQIERPREWLDSLLYYKCEEHGSIVGACAVEINVDKAKIHGIHVVSESMGQDIGSYKLREKREFVRVIEWQQ